MATKKNQKFDLPGTLYQRNKRWWWKAQLPGDEAPKARAMKPLGAKFATTDYSVARDLALNLWQIAVYARSRPETVTAVTNIASLAAAYLQHCDGYYIDQEGKPTKEIYEVRYTLKPLTEFFGAMAVEDFGPLRLIEVRDHMIQLDWSRKLINQRIGRVKRMFKWAVSRQLVSPIIYHGISTVEGLKRGRSMARETPKRRPVAEEYVRAVLPHTTSVVATMIELQMLTGMRPGELVIMRPCDIERDGEVWHYLPEKHKNQYRDIERIVSIGPRGQEILRPYLLRPADKFCFSPAESEEQRLKSRNEKRVVPAGYGNTRGTNRVKKPQFQPSEVYTVSAYGHTVNHALTAANKAIKEKARADGIDDPQLIPHWTPYQLRHTAATKVRREMGYETAGATLGHKNMSATAIYAERNQGLADKAARKFG